MQDRHLFRGKRLDNGEWVYGSYIEREELSGDGQFIPLIFNDRKHADGWYSHEVDPATLGQCTGLKDKTGKLIFEGDIVRIGEWECYAKVIWRRGALELCVGFGAGAEEYLYDFMDECEIIGNRHDNPNLLEEPNA